MFKSKAGSLPFLLALVTCTGKSTGGGHPDGNAAPAAADLRFVAAIDWPFDGSLDGSDPDGDTLTFRLARGPAHGQVRIVDPEAGRFSYTPDAAFSGIDTFTYDAFDGALASAAATVTMEMVAVGDFASTGQDVPLTGQLQAAGGAGTQTFTLVDAGMHATVTVGSDGSYTFTPSAGYFGLTRFLFEVTDDGGSRRGVQTINVIEAIPLAAGNQACVIRPDRSLWCWGGFGQPAVPTREATGQSDWIAVSGFGCAITTTGELWCWGTNVFGQVGNGTTDTVAEPVRIGTDRDWSKVATQVNHRCALKADGSVWCWGRNNAGQLGVDSGAESILVPTRFVPANDEDFRFAAVQLTSSGTCGLRDDGVIWCWGTPLNSPLDVPTPIFDALRWRDLRTGGSQPNICATRLDDTMWCIGHSSASFGIDLSTGSVHELTMVGDAGSGWRTISRTEHGCGVKVDGSLWCWGRNMHGELGGGTQRESLVPARVGVGTDWRWVVAASGPTTAALQQDGSVWSWGKNWAGWLGIDVPETIVDPVEPLPGETWSAVDTGNATCAIRDDASLWCWGPAGHFTVGDGTALPRQTPVQIGSSRSWLAVEAGEYQTCALDTDRDLYCWGDATYASMGDGGGESAAAPVRVLGPGGWVDFDLGWRHACAIDGSGKLWCWGDNAKGQLDPARPRQREATPVQIGSDSDWAQVSGGDAFSCARKHDGTLWCWGSTLKGRLGNSDDSDSVAGPVEVGSAGWTAVSSGMGHTCAIDTDRSLWCWGEGWYGVLGNGSWTDALLPVREATLTTDWAAVDASRYDTCAIRLDGSSWCWGRNDGIFGDGTTADSSTPIDTGKTVIWRSVGDSSCWLESDDSMHCVGDVRSVGVGGAFFPTPQRVLP